MSFTLLSMPWLPVPPADFRQQLKQARAEPDGLRNHGRRLATYGLDLNALSNLGKALEAWLASPEAAVNGLVKIGMVSNGTTDLLRPTLAPSLLRHGVHALALGSPFGQVAQQALDPSSPLNSARCDFMLFAVDHRGLGLEAAPGNAEVAASRVDTALQQLQAQCAAMARHSGATPVVQTLPQVPDALFGNLDRALPGTLPWLIDAFNRRLLDQYAAWGCLLVDVASLAGRVGLDAWHDPVQWTLGKFLMAQQCVPLYADWVARVIAAARGKARKCLVLDLDNTLWSGVIGDDGLAGIVLGNGSAVGEAHLSVQQAALQLRDRGVVLAVSSKNDDAVARTPFRDHPEMLLREEHIAVFQANWRDKASNLEAIARTLNIGIDALVFLDDNPAERAQVRQALPEVAVPELPDDAAFYVRTLVAGGYFESTGFTAEDRVRAAQYQANAERAALQEGAADLNGYLLSLDMVARFDAFDEVGRARITQLINKTNQFNLTTRRYTEAQVREFEQSPAGLTLQVRLADRFGDNGMIAVVICTAEGDAWHIDTWLMSCRVLNRKVEEATLQQICRAARAAGVPRLVGHYTSSGRNGMVADHYEKLGFTRLEGGEAGSTWALDLDGYAEPQLPMRMEVSLARPALA